MLRKMTRLSLIFVLPVIAALVLTSLVLAHGSLLTPLSRAYTCYLENPENPDTLPCQDVVNMGGTQPLYDWNEVNIGQGGENSRSLIPDGRLCSAGRSKYYGYDQGRADWPITTIPAAGSPYTFQLAVTANHPIATFYFYVTKNGYNPNVPLKWSDLEDQPFLVVDNPTLDAVAGLPAPVYQFSTNLPNKTGRHLIYTMWVRHDSLENFYMCTDVWFGASAKPTPTAAPACSAPEWVGGGSYPAGTVVSHNGKQWTSKWTNSDEPNVAISPWKYEANCTYSGASGAPLPTATFIKISTATAGPSPTACTNCGPTNTPPAPTATLPIPTRTATMGVVNTATRTPTAGPTATRTRTATPGGPTATRTATVWPTATRAGTMTQGPSNTPTRTVTAGPTSAGACSPVTSTITAPFTFDGAGTFCWQASTLANYINSWNTTSVSVNGVNYTNLYGAVGSLPAKINGFWYISYNSTVAWGHFEAK